MQEPTSSELIFAVCVRSDAYPASLEVRKLYQVVPDADAAADGYVRIVDESGEDYLYPAAYFMPIDLPRAVQAALLRAA